MALQTKLNGTSTTENDVEISSDKTSSSHEGDITSNISTKTSTGATSSSLTLPITTSTSRVRHGSNGTITTPLISEKGGEGGSGGGSNPIEIQVANPPSKPGLDVSSQEIEGKTIYTLENTGVTSLNGISKEAIIKAKSEDAGIEVEEDPKKKEIRISNTGIKSIVVKDAHGETKCKGEVKITDGEGIETGSGGSEAEPEIRIKNTGVLSLQSANGTIEVTGDIKIIGADENIHVAFVKDSGETGGGTITIDVRWL